MVEGADKSIVHLLGLRISTPNQSRGGCLSFTVVLRWFCDDCIAGFAEDVLAWVAYGFDRQVLFIH